jgi:hypothetical protein
VTLEILAEATALADPGEGAFDDPPLGQHDEAVEIGPLDDLQFPRPGLGDELCHLRPLIAAIGIDAFDEGEGPPGLPEHGGGPIAVLNIGGMDDDAQEEAEGIDEDMALAALDLLARVEARRVDRGPPFTAPLALWASMMATVGLASRPSRARASM